MPLGFGLGRPLTPLSVATSAFSPAITCRRASFSASSRSARAPSSPRGRPERLICFEADMAETGRVRADPAQPRQLTSARPFAPRTARDTAVLTGPLPVATRIPTLGADQRRHVDQLEQRAVVPAPVVLAPRHLARVELEVRPADVVVPADLGPGQGRREKKLSAWWVQASSVEYAS